VKETRAPLHARRAGEIRRPRHERLARRGDGCGLEVVINTEQLREFQADFEEVRLADQSKYKRLEELRCSFEKHFPRVEISRLTLDEFVQGKGSDASFCYWVERKMTELGHIQGAPATKFGVYYSKKKNSFQFTNKFKSKKNPFGSILKEIGDLLDAAEKDNLDAIQSADWACFDKVDREVESFG
jgi:hypothetical protein